MEKIRAAITAVNAYLPNYILSNAELKLLVNKTDDWIIERTGIRERRILKDDNHATSDLAVNAIKGLITKTKINVTEIDLIICATITPDMMFPSTACIIADKIGANGAYGFDINAACCGFIYALDIATTMIECNRYKKVLVVAADKMSSIVDYTKDNCILFGDGAGVALVEASQNEYGVKDSILKSNGLGKNHLHMKAGGSLKPATLDTINSREHYLYIEGGAVFKSAVANMTAIAEEILRKNNITAQEVDWFFPHQANKRITDAIISKLDINEYKVAINIHKYGNTSAATIPICLWEWEKQLKEGDKVILVAFGAGYTWGATYLQWAYNS